MKAGTAEKSLRTEVLGKKIHIKQITDRVFRFRTSSEGHYYTVIYGYSIDNDPNVWDRIKYIYDSKHDVKIIDRQLKRAAVIL